VTDPPDFPLELVHRATQSTVQTVDALTDSQWAEPSLLPGWSRAHVVAHLTNHAQGVARAVHGLRHQRASSVYDSNDSRDQDIERLAARQVEEIRERFLTSVTDVYDALRHLTPGLRSGTVERTPGSGPFPAGELVLQRWREVEIHHADLGAGFTPANWSRDFTTYLLPVVAWDRGDELDLTLRTPDEDFVVGVGGQVIEGSAHDLTWWLLGRGAGEGLIGDLPSLGPWTRRPTPVR